MNAQIPDNSRMSRRWVAFSVVIVSGIWCAELLLHWILARNQGSFLFAVYVTQDTGRKYFFSGLIDYTLPAIFLGFAIGWKSWPEIKRNWKSWPGIKLNHASVFIACASILIAIFRPAYRLLFGSAPFTEIWGDSAFVFTRAFLFAAIFTFLPAFVFLQGTYTFRDDLLKRRGESLDDLSR